MTILVVFYYDWLLDHAFLLSPTYFWTDASLGGTFFCPCGCPRSEWPRNNTDSYGPQNSEANGPSLVKRLCKSVP